MKRGGPSYVRPGFSSRRLSPRPLRIDDAVIHGMADAAARGDHAVVEAAFLFGPEARQGLAGVLVEGRSALNSTRMQPHVLKVWRSMRYLASTLAAVGCHRRPSHVHPMSTRRFARWMLLERVLPMPWPVAFSIVAKGGATPLARSSKAALAMSRRRRRRVRQAHTGRRPQIRRERCEGPHFGAIPSPGLLIAFLVNPASNTVVDTLTSRGTEAARIALLRLPLTI